MVERSQFALGDTVYDYDPDQDQNDVEDFITGVDKFIGFTEDEKELFAKENTLTFPN